MKIKFINIYIGEENLTNFTRDYNNGTLGFTRASINEIFSNKLKKNK